MWVVYCTPYKPWCWLTVVCYLQGMPDRMLCAVLEQFQLYFSLWYVRFVSIQNHFFLCSYVETACTLFFFCIHTCTQTYTQPWTCTGNTSSHLLTLYSRLCSYIYWCLGVRYDEDHVWSFQMVSYWSCSYVNTLVLCSMCAALCITVAIQQCNNNSCLILNNTPLFWQFKSG